MYNGRFNPDPKQTQPIVIPKALQSAFDQPEENKKPFTYFGGGQTPDLSHKPSPRAVRRAADHSAFKCQNLPKVLPIVPPNPGEDQVERRYSTAFLDQTGKISQSNADRAVDRATTMSSAFTNSSQYNTPIKLYSKEALNADLRAQQGHVVNGDVPFKSMANYNQTHQFDSSQERETAAAEENYKNAGLHSNPKSQSPCFKRLQYATGLHTDSEDEPAVEVRPTDVRTMVNGCQTPAVQSDTVPTIKPRTTITPYQHVEPSKTPLLQRSATSGPDFELEKQQPLPQSQFQQPLREPQKPYEPPSGAAIEDSAFLSKISEAERPKVPPKIVPEWTKQATLKQEKWRGYAEHLESNRYEGPRLPPSRLASPAPWQSRKSPVPSGGSFTLPRSTQQRKDISKQSTEKETWMKPYVSSNVIESNFTTPLSVRTSMPTPTYKVYSPGESSRVEQSRIYDSSSTTNRHYQSTPTPYSFSTTKTQEQQTTKEPSVAPRYKIETTYFTPVTPKPEMHGRSMSRQSPAPWTPGGGGSTYAAYRPPTAASSVKDSGVKESSVKEPIRALFEHEGEAYQKKKELEKEMMKKTTTMHRSASSPGWRPVSSDRKHVQGGEEPVAVTQQWQDASGANTKSQTSGSYVDSDGNVVHYVKEVYTSSDPGQEFSMLSQQERKVLEEPLEPGVIARHTTTKYYKKATYTSSTTTSTSQSTPSITNRPMATSAITLPRSRPPYKSPVVETAY